MAERELPKRLALYDSAAALRLVDQAIRELAEGSGDDDAGTPVDRTTIDTHLSDIRTRAMKLIDDGALGRRQPAVLARAADKLLEVRALLGDAEAAGEGAC